MACYMLTRPWRKDDKIYINENTFAGTNRIFFSNIDLFCEISVFIFLKCFTNPFHQPAEKCLIYKNKCVGVCVLNRQIHCNWLVLYRIRQNHLDLSVIIRISLACTVYWMCDNLTWLHWIPTIIATNKLITSIHHFSNWMDGRTVRMFTEFVEWFHFISFLCVLNYTTRSHIEPPRYHWDDLSCCRVSRIS